MKYKPIERVDYLVVHCAATRPNQDIGATEIRRWHRERGWFDIGYHYVIRRDGEVETGRPVDRPGAHARGFNHKSLGICLVGGVGPDGKSPEDNFTPEQYASLTVLITQLLTLSPDAEVLGHRDLPNVAKACPSFEVRSWWEAAQEKPHEQDRQEQTNLATEGQQEGQAIRDLLPPSPHPLWTRICPRRKRH